jgi:glycine hydroxymethyltransferase
MHVIAAKAVCFLEAMQPEFIEYQRNIQANAKALAKTFLANKFNIVSGGTDNHLLCLDLRSLAITGKKASALLQEVDITVNKNTIPNDPEKPFVGSGIRMGSPAVTTRGMGVKEMETIANLITKILKTPGNETIKSEVRETVAQLCRQFPIYTNLNKKSLAAR